MTEMKFTATAAEDTTAHTVLATKEVATAAEGWAFLLTEHLRQAATIYAEDDSLRELFYAAIHNAVEAHVTGEGDPRTLPSGLELDATGHLYGAALSDGDTDVIPPIKYAVTRLPE